MYRVLIEHSSEREYDLYAVCNTLEEAKQNVEESKELYDVLEEEIINLKKDELTEKIEDILDKYEYDEEEDNIGEIVDALGKMGIYALDLYDGVGEDIYESFDMDAAIEQVIDEYELDDEDEYGVVEDTDFTYVFNTPGESHRTIIYNDITKQIVNEDEPELSELDIKRMKMFDKVEKEMKERIDKESTMKFQSMQTLKEILPAKKTNKVKKVVKTEYQSIWDYI